MRKLSWLLLVVLVASMALSACGGEEATATPVPAEATEPPAVEAPTEAPAAAAPGELKDIPRNRTLVLAWGASETHRYEDHELWNGYAVGSNHQNGLGIFYEPLCYYSAFGDKMYPWLAESWEYNDDFTELTVKTRPGISWSDGEPFSAEDIAFTWNELTRQGANVKWGVNVQQFVDTAEAVDDNTVVVQFKSPAPRFMYFNCYKFDIGVYPVPKHIFETSDDWSTFTAFDLEKGWPVTTGPWKLVHSTPEQKIIDRRDDWWAVDAGLTTMPEVERIIYLPFPGETQTAQGLITNDIDMPLDLRPRTIKQVLAQNEKITTHAGRELPYGYVDWWPTSLYLNNTKPPFDNPDVRWAVSYYIDRQQVIDVGYEGAGTMSKLPLPSYAPLMKYYDAVKDLLEEYDTNEYNPEKGDALMEGAGFTKDGDGFWVDENGDRIALPINGWTVMADIGPVVAEQLRRAGFDATYQMPVDAGDQFDQGTYIAQLSGHGGSVADPYFTLNLYQSVSEAVPSTHMVNRSLWNSPEFDAIVDQIYLTPMEDTDTLVDLTRQALEIWLLELPDVQITEWYHRIPMNTTYWENYPTADNPYVNGAFWHLTFQLILNNLKATQ